MRIELTDDPREPSDQEIAGEVRAGTIAAFPFCADRQQQER
jgi:hypothetical protein